MNLNLIKLEIVELLGRHKKITAVAKILGLSQPTVTFHLKSLEQELGVCLFESRLGKIYLTEAGQALCHYASKINALSGEALRVVKEFQDVGKGTLAIGASYVPATYLLPALISSFSRSYPTITISLSVKTAPVIKDMLRNHEIDLGVFSAEPFRLPELTAGKLCDDEMVVIFAPSSPLRQHAELSPEMLADVPFLCHNPQSSTQEMTRKWMADNGVELHVVMELDSLEVIKQAVIAGAGVSFVSRLAVEREVLRGELCYRHIPQNKVARSVFYSYNLNRHSSALLHAFILHLQTIGSTLETAGEVREIAASPAFLAE